MNWGSEQDAAMKAVSRWLNDPSQQVFRLFGYAGTGKTTLARHLAEGVDGTVLFGAYTGKAAYVLRTKGCPGASTIHSMIYCSRGDSGAKLKELEAAYVSLVAQLRSEGMDDETIKKYRRTADLLELIRRERDNQARPMFRLNPDAPIKEADLVVIDECSMVDGRMGEDLLSFGKKVLVLGDPAQLPPVGGGGFFTEDVTPDIMLTDIHRQAADNPIIRLATATRQEQRLELGTYGTSKVVDRSGVRPEDGPNADQVLVGKNDTRRVSNMRLRKQLGREGDPIPGDKLVCLQNDHEKGLLNGQIWFAEGHEVIDDDRSLMLVRSEDTEQTIEVQAHRHYFQGRDKDLAWYEKKEASSFDYGYALTVHKSQGSQWKNVFLFDESSVFRADRWRWLYTGITRAAESVIIYRS